MVDISGVWNQALAVIEKELSKPSFETWLIPTKALDYKNNTFYINVPNDFAMDWLKSRYTDLIKDTLRTIIGQPVDIQFVVPTEDITVNTFTESPKPIPEKDDSLSTYLNPKYTFDTFVVGNSNRFAHAASLAVAEAPARAYNPLFIYGGVGLGKTHLMHAIGHYILENNPLAKIVYVSSEKFTNELINSIRDDKPDDFRNRYRNMDVLLIDDIQFLAKKERTQEEFFHTFNALHDANKQIVISSDRPPKEIPTLEDRLRSRFEWGLITDIQSPDLETRIAILRKKALTDNVEIPDNDVLFFIADKIESNIRELEGALTRVMAYAYHNNRKVTPELAEEILKDILPATRPKQISIPVIQEIVATYFNLTTEDFKAKNRTRSIAFPRQIAMTLCRELTDASLPVIGQEFGGRDHTTVIHAQEKVQEDIKNNLQLAKVIEDLRTKIRNA